MIRHFAAIVDNEVFHEISINDDLEYGARWSAGLLSSPEFINTDLIHSVCVGAIWDGQNFYMPDDLNKENPILPQDKPRIDKMVKFTAVSDGESFGTVTFYPEDTSDEMLDLIRAGFSSNPIIIETTGRDEILLGYIWNGTDLVSPEAI